MKKNVIYVDFKFTRKRIVSKKLYLFCKINYLIKNFFNSFFKKDIPINSEVYPFKKIL